MEQLTTYFLTTNQEKSSCAAPTELNNQVEELFPPVSTVYFSLHQNQALGLARRYIHTTGRTGRYDESVRELLLYFHPRHNDDIEKTISLSIASH